MHLNCASGVRADLSVGGDCRFFRLTRLEIPVHGATETFFEADFGLVAELSPGSGDVGEGVLDVPFPGRAIDGWLGEA